MGDRNNPIKFGPEWLRNLSREPSAGGSGNNNHNSPPGCPVNNGTGSQGTGAAAMSSNSGNTTVPNTGNMSGPNFGAILVGPVGATSSSPVASSSSNGGGATASGPPIPGPSTGAIPKIKTNNHTPKVQLAKLRYGREEMLALYDRSAESPEELKQFGALYQPRGKPPFALKAAEEEARDNGRGAPIAGVVSVPERYGLGRGGSGRVNVNEGRGRCRMPFVRQTSQGRGTTSWNLTNIRLPNYNTGPDEDTTLRPWNNGNGGAQVNRTTSEPPEWSNNKIFRRRPNNNSNWRQSHSRDENDEWRAQENPRGRPSVDKWDREWGERPNDRQQLWHGIRRPWVGNETQNNDDNLPEWAVDSTEAGAGTFDASGAFHGFSNDDTNLANIERESSFPLARSHTHGSFVRTKTTEDGSDEWWASDKANKLATKKNETGDSKYMHGITFGSIEGVGIHFKPSVGIDDEEDDLLDEIDKQHDENIDPPQSPEGNASTSEVHNQSIGFTSQFQDNNQFENLVRDEISIEDAAEERNNYQSVMLTPNNTLRQKHQNLVAGAMNPVGLPLHNAGLLQIMHAMPRNESPDPLSDNLDNSDEKLVEKILDMTLEDSKLQTPMIGQMHPSGINPGMPNQMVNANLQLHIGANHMMTNQGLVMKAAPNMQMTGLQSPLQPMQNVGLSNQINTQIQNIGIHNSALNSSLGLTIGPNNGNMMPIQGVPPPVIPNTSMQARLGFQANSGMPMIPSGNVGNPSFFMPTNNPPPMQSGDIPLPNSNAQSNMFPMHPMQHSGSPGPFGSIYSHPPPNSSDPNLMDTWFYEDPEKHIQGPFSSKEMYNWFRAGFFTPSLMVRRACEPHMRPLGSYGPVVPFIQLDTPPPFQLTHDSRRQLAMGLEPPKWKTPVELTVITPNPDSLWSQPPPNADLIWMQQMNPRNESRINNLPMFFWDSQGSSAISSNSLLPEEITKEMKTEDEILAQLRASQKLPTSPTVSFLNDPPPTSSANPVANLTKPEESFSTNVSATPNLEELQKLIQPEKLTSPPPFQAQVPKSDSEKSDNVEAKMKDNSKIVKTFEEPAPKPESPTAVVTKQQQAQSKVSDTKTAKQPKGESEKNAKKETVSTKGKGKKSKEEKKEDVVPEVKAKEDEVPLKVEKRSTESSPSKGKKEEKQNKKDQEKEKKITQEMAKDGFTVVKAVDKASNKENKKKAEEAKALAVAVEEAEKKKKEEEKLLVEEEKKRKIAEAIKKAQEQQQQRQEYMTRKAPWSVSAQGAPISKEGLNLAEIQRLEREKKAEQIKEQQQMMQIIAQQQAAAVAREQEMQAGLGWAKKKASNVNVSGQSLAEIQAETRKAAAAAAATAVAAVAQALDESPLASISQVPWSSTHNGALTGFWEPQLNLNETKMEKAGDVAKTSDSGKNKKKVTLNISKKETSPEMEFDEWCTGVLACWSSKVDVPTFVGFLKDIESPYEVKDYVKCYLGETKDSNDFARQFLERRSKLLRVGMVTPSDDLCSPAMAINPRNSNLGDYQEVKGKGKKSKKNKMLKVDARILGFSVTAAEDRINVGDIDTV